MENVPKIEKESNLLEKVEKLESRVKGLKWHKRIAYALAISAGLGFAAEKIDNMANENAKDIIRDRIENFSGHIDLLEANDVDWKGEGLTGLTLEFMQRDMEQVKDVLEESDKDIFERMILAPDAE